MKLKNETATFLNVAPLGYFPISHFKRDPNLSTLSMVYTGHIGERSCIREIVQAISFDNLDVLLTIYGPTLEPEYIEMIRRDAERLGVKDKIKIMGFIPRTKIHEVISKADIGVVLYLKHEKFSWGSNYCCPNKLFEYVAAGLTILASNQESIKGWVEGSSIGICVDPKNVHSISNGIKYLADPIRRAQMKKRAKDSFLKEWNLEKQASRAWDKICDII